MYRNTLIATSLLLSAGAAAADVTYATAFAKSHNLDIATLGDTNLNVLGGGLEYVTGGWTFSGEVARYHVDGVDIDFATLGAGYALASGVTLGLELSRFEFDDISTDFKSVYAMYETGPYAVGLAIGDAEDADDAVYTLFGAWDVTETGRVGLDIISVDSDTLIAGYADYDTGAYAVRADALSSDEFDVLAVAGSYDLGNDFSLIGSLARFDLLGLDGHAVTIGGRFSFAPNANVELAVGRLDLDGAPKVDLMTFGVTYELGRKTSKRRSFSNILTGATASVAGISSF